MGKYIFSLLFLILSFVVVGCEKEITVLKENEVTKEKLIDLSVVITSGNHSYIPISRCVRNKDGEEMRIILDIITHFEKNNPSLTVTDWKLREEKVYHDTRVSFQYGIFIDHIEKERGEK